MSDTDADNQEVPGSGEPEDQADQPQTADPDGGQAPAAGEAEDAASPAGDAEIAAAVEAVIFSSDKPLPAAKINELGQFGGARKVRETIDALNARYEAMGCAFRIAEIAGGFQMQTLPEYADVLARLHKSRTDAKLSQAALETLAIIAYRQPVLRANVEAIRGVSCGEVLRGLMERNLVKIVGRAEEIGRPMLYGTTRFFLEVFGLAGLEDLPNIEQLRKAAQQAGKPQSPPAEGSPPAVPTEATPASPETPPAAPEAADTQEAPPAEPSEE